MHEDLIMPSRGIAIFIHPQWFGGMVVGLGVAQSVKRSPQAVVGAVSETLFDLGKQASNYIVVIREQCQLTFDKCTSLLLKKNS